MNYQYVNNLQKKYKKLWINLNDLENNTTDKNTSYYITNRIGLYINEINITYGQVNKKKNILL